MARKMKKIVEFVNNGCFFGRTIFLPLVHGKQEFKSLNYTKKKNRNKMLNLNEKSLTLLTDLGVKNTL